MAPARSAAGWRRRTGDTRANMARARPSRSRLDDLLVERGLAADRDAALRLVLAGKVRVGQGDAVRRDHKPGELIAADAIVEIAAAQSYVSRGGEKLAAALDEQIVKA